MIIGVWKYTDSWVYNSKLVGTGGSGTTSQGYGCAISKNGSYIAIGGPESHSGVGRTWVFFDNGSGYVQQTIVSPPTFVGTPRFGYSVSLDEDGDTLCVAGPGDNSDRGAIWIFIRSGSSWSIQADRLIGTGNTGITRRGESVALSNDGNTAAVGGPSNNSSIGAVWVWTRSVTTWTQQTVIYNPLATNNNFGRAVALSTTGDKMAVNLEKDNSRGFIYSRSVGVWTVEATLTATGISTVPAYTNRGIALSPDGTLCCLGFSNDYTPANVVWKGSVVIFRNSGSWGQIQTIYGNTIDGAKFGDMISISTNRINVGGPLDNSSAGANFIFSINPTTYQATQEDKLVFGTIPTNGQQGVSLSIATTGSYVIGARSNNADYRGFIYDYVSTNTYLKTNIVITSSELTATYCYVAMSGDGNFAAISKPNVGNIGEVRTLSKQNGSWIVGSALNGAPFTGQAFFGRSLVLDGTGSVLAIGGNQYSNPDTNNKGRVWIYSRSNYTYSLVTYLTPMGSENDFGYSLAISGDGTVLCVGSPYSAENLSSNFTIYRNNGTWTLETQIYNTDSLYENFASSVSLTTTGTRLVVGGRIENSLTTQKAGVVYNYSNGGWSKIQDLSVPGVTTIDTPYDCPVSIGGDGNAIIIGNAGENSGSGSVLIFSSSLTTESNYYTYRSKILPTYADSYMLKGYAVALNHDSTKLLIGNLTDETTEGSVSVFTIVTNGQTCVARTTNVCAHANPCVKTFMTLANAETEAKNASTHLLIQWTARAYINTTDYIAFSSTYYDSSNNSRFRHQLEYGVIATNSILVEDSLDKDANILYEAPAYTYIANYMSASKDASKVALGIDLSAQYRPPKIYDLTYDDLLNEMNFTAKTGPPNTYNSLSNYTSCFAIVTDKYFMLNQNRDIQIYHYAGSDFSFAQGITLPDTYNTRSFGFISTDSKTIGIFPQIIATNERAFVYTYNSTTTSWVKYGQITQTLATVEGCALLDNADDVYYGDNTNFNHYSIPIPTTNVIYSDVITGNIIITAGNNITSDLIINDDVIDSTPIPLVVTVANATYSCTALATTIQSLVNNYLVPGTFIATFTDSTNKYTVNCASAVNVYADCTICELMGITNTKTNVTTFVADAPAILGGPNYLLIKSTAIGKKKETKTFMDGGYDDIIAKVPVDVNLGDILIYRPAIPQKILYSRPAIFTQLDFALEDSNGRLVNLNGSDWTIELRFVTK